MSIYKCMSWELRDVFILIGEATTIASHNSKRHLKTWYNCYYNKKITNFFFNKIHTQLNNHTSNYFLFIILII